MIQKWVIGMAISFVMRQIGKWGKSIDWAKVKADAEERVKALVPGEFFDAEAVALVHSLIDMAQAVLSATGELEKVIQLIVDGKMQEAWVVLRDLILKNWQPKTPAEQKVMACVQDCEAIA